MRQPTIANFIDDIPLIKLDVSARVLDENQDPVYANIWVKGEPTFGTQTNFDTGEFALTQVPINSVLVFSYQDVKTEIPVSQIGDRVMINTSSSLQEVDLGIVKPKKDKKTNWWPWILGTLTIGGIAYIVMTNKPQKVSL